jgi:TfoX/Sxy family transcriptional regulator of competence genes
MSKKMIAFSPELSEFLEKKLKEYGYDPVKKKMFGHETYFFNGYMFTGANVEGIFVHVGKEEKERALEDDQEVGAFEPMEGMVMKEYVLLKENVYSDESQLKKWLEKSRKYLLSLPPKKKKRKY